MPSVQSVPRRGHDDRLGVDSSSLAAAVLQLHVCGAQQGTEAAETAQAAGQSASRGLLQLRLLLGTEGRIDWLDYRMTTVEPIVYYLNFVYNYLFVIYLR